MLEVSDPDNLLTFLIGIALLVKKFGEMERYHQLRVYILTFVLSSIVILFFLGYGLTLGNPHYYTCTLREP